METNISSNKAQTTIKKLLIFPTTLKFHLRVCQEGYGYYGNIHLIFVLILYPLVIDLYIVIFEIILKRLLGRDSY